MKEKEGAENQTTTAKVFNNKEQQARDVKKEQCLFSHIFLKEVKETNFVLSL